MPSEEAIERAAIVLPKPGREIRSREVVDTNSQGMPCRYPARSRARAAAHSLTSADIDDRSATSPPTDLSRIRQIRSIRLAQSAAEDPGRTASTRSDGSSK